MSTCEARILDGGDAVEREGPWEGGGEAAGKGRKHDMQYKYGFAALMLENQIGHESVEMLKKKAR